MSEARNKSSADRKLDRPGNLGGSNSWEDAGSWQHGGLQT
jgi:hypothetical protein